MSEPLFELRAVPEEGGPGYEEYCAVLEEEEKRARKRHPSSAPMAWGTRMTDESYFCTACWLTGDLTGAHPYLAHPCDPDIWRRHE